MWSPRTLAVVAAALAVGTHALGINPTPAANPCAKIAGIEFVAPTDALACLRSVPFNETIRQNVVANAEGVLDFYTFEDYYFPLSPPPFQESTVNIRGELARIKAQHYATDYDFSVDLYNLTTRMNDGHTRWFPDCYNVFQNLLPAPVIGLAVNGVENVYIIPDLVALVSELPATFTQYLASIGFNWQRLAGAKVLAIEGMNPYDYIDIVAREISGNFLDHGVRVNSVFSSYRIVSGAFSQRFGDLAGPSLPTLTGLTFQLITVNSTKVETVRIPYVASFGGAAFTDDASFFENNCALTNTTNGVNELQQGGISRTSPAPVVRKEPVAKILEPAKGVNLPPQFVPTSTPISQGNSLIFYILPGSKTGVIFVGDFEPDDFFGFQVQTMDGINKFLAAGVTSVIIDLSGNGGGFVCLGLFLHQVFAGTNFGYSGFQSSMRANPLAQKIVKAVIAQDIEFLNYQPDNYASLNGTELANTVDLTDPPVPIIVNGKVDENSIRFEDTCSQFSFDPNVTIPATAPFDFNKVAIVGNAFCASTCALFSTAMIERHPQIKTAIFGGRPGQSIQYKGMAGNQVLEWADLDTEIKTSGLGGDPLAPPDLLVGGNFRVNWRTAWSFKNEQLPIAYVSEPATRFAYTADTYNNPQNLWTFVAKNVLHSI